MSFTQNVATWLGVVPNALQSGRVDSYVGVNNDKTGYSLTAGSYSVRASSIQSARMDITSGNTNVTAAISSVTTTRTHVTSSHAAGGAVDETICYLSSSTQLTADRNQNVLYTTFTQYDVQELF